jgi:hypothetical protein
MSTGIMGALCLSVYKKERTTAQYSGSGYRLSKMVFKQACWFVVAFYVTWVPYLALQYLWSSGKAYQMYGFILYSGTFVPLQGLWNFFAYVCPRYANEETFSSVISTSRNYLSSVRSTLSGSLWCCINCLCLSR